MNGQPKQVETKIRVEPAHLDKLAEWVRRNGRPHTLKALTRRYIEIIKESAGIR